MDIDIDFANRDDILKIIKHIPAAIFDKGAFSKKHNSGVYVQKIPYNPLTNTASIDYRTAEDRGYFKIDFLNVSAYKDVKNEDHLIQLMNTEPLWELLHEKLVCDQLFHVNGYHELLKKLNPRSVEELAICLALIRPGKKYLQERCIQTGFKSIESEIWKKPSTGEYYFKKGHSHAYAMVVVVQLNLLCETIN